MKSQDGILGVLVGDALGVPFEFEPREEFIENPVTDMIAYGVHNQPLGTWSDDGSLTLATLESLTRGLDYEDILTNFVSWLMESKFSATDTVFDIGIGTRVAILNFHEGEEPLLSGGDDVSNNGNGSLMRILPIAYYIFDSNMDINQWVPIVHNLSSLTHRHIRSQIACGIYINIALKLLSNPGYDLIDLIRNGIDEITEYYKNNEKYNSEFEAHFNRIFSGEIYNLPEDDILSSGYVIATLEASIWCLTNTNSYKEAVIKAVNLGHDTDTTAAVTGGLAGIYYGYDNIPSDWVSNIQKLDYVLDLCKTFDSR